jgi:DNA-binding GntR family transcriptional regulator
VSEAPILPDPGPLKEPMTQVVARHLREAIFEGDLAPGSRVRQEAVATELGVSRIPVREALRQLESEGLVTITPNSGARVAALNFAEYTEIYKIRERLEPLALTESIENLTDEQRTRVVELAAEVELLTDDLTAWLEADRTFHLACYAGVPTPRLLRMIVDFWNTTQRYRKVLLTTFTPDDFAVVHDEHRLIANAIVEGNVRGGEDLIRMHIERSRLRLGDHRDLFED